MWISVLNRLTKPMFISGNSQEDINQQIQDLAQGQSMAMGDKETQAEERVGPVEAKPKKKRKTRSDKGKARKKSLQRAEKQLSKWKENAGLLEKAKDLTAPEGKEWTRTAEKAPEPKPKGCVDCTDVKD